ncbi:MAG: histidine triad nucleotide-binding protein [Anaerolineaceae bacterium]|nr:histidine triad nucleotide-binding protein [Anaerolineaceae bacterium]
MSGNCIFCRIIAGQAPAEFVYQDDSVTAFFDQHPAAPVHLLITPNKHISSINQISENDAVLLGHMLVVARNLAEQKEINQNGYRLVINTGADAGQTIHHIHLHLLGGERLSGMNR